MFANHFSGEGLERALDLYRTAFLPTETHPAPRTFLTVERRSPRRRPTRPRPARCRNLRMTARLRTNKPLVALETVEQAIAGAGDFDGLGESFMASARAKWFVGTGARSWHPISPPSPRGTASTRS